MPYAYIELLDNVPLLDLETIRGLREGVRHRVRNEGEKERTENLFSKGT